jgi:hypothetical protein
MFALFKEREISFAISVVVIISSWEMKYRLILCHLEKGSKNLSLKATSLYSREMIWMNLLLMNSSFTTNSSSKLSHPRLQILSFRAWSLA